MRLNKIAEQRIRAAEAEGKLSNLKGAGKPLPKTGAGDQADAVGFRIMAEAGALPEEMKLRKELAALREKVAASTARDGVVSKADSAALADLEMRLAIQEEARRRFDRY